MSKQYTRLAISSAVLACVCLGATAQAGASPQQQTIPLNLSLDNLITVNATLTVDAAAVEASKLVVIATASGSATLNGRTATLSTQPFTLTVATTCKAGTGTVTLTTTPLVATLSGATATIAAETITLSASCGRRPSLSLAVSPLSASISDGTSLSTSQCSAALSAPASTTLGSAICDIQQLICALNADIAAGTITEAIELLKQVLTKVTSTLA